MTKKIKTLSIPQKIDTYLWLILFFLLGLSYVLVRMKSVEQDFAVNKLVQDMKKKEVRNKELRAKRAQELSVDNLQKISKRYGLKIPDQKHILVIPSR